MLTKRLQVLIDEDRLERLRRESARVGAPVGELVRRAIDREYPSRLASREVAGRRLLDRALPRGPEPDWEVAKQEMLDGLADRLERASG